MADSSLPVAWTLRDIDEWCKSLPETDDGRRRKAELLLAFDTGLPLRLIEGLDLASIDLERGMLALPDCDYCLSQFSIDAVADYRKGITTNLDHFSLALTVKAYSAPRVGQEGGAV